MSSGPYGVLTSPRATAVSTPAARALSASVPPARTMKALGSLARLRQALCSSSSAVSRTQLTGSQSAVPTRCMAVARAVRSPAKDKDTEDITVEQKVQHLCNAEGKRVTTAIGTVQHT